MLTLVVVGSLDDLQCNWAIEALGSTGRRLTPSHGIPPAIKGCCSGEWDGFYVVVDYECFQESVYVLERKKPPRFHRTRIDEHVLVRCFGQERFLAPHVIPSFGRGGASAHKRTLSGGMRKPLVVNGDGAARSQH